MVFAARDGELLTVLIGLFFTVLSPYAASIHVIVTETHFIVRSSFRSKPIKYFRLDECRIIYYWPRWMWILCTAQIKCKLDQYIIVGFAIKKYGQILDILEEKGEVI